VGGDFVPPIGKKNLGPNWEANRAQLGRPFQSILRTITGMMMATVGPRGGPRISNMSIQNIEEKFI
jgi:hypothetical protein